MNEALNWLNPLDAILVMIDFQGRLAEIVQRNERVIPNAVRLIKGCHALDVPVLPTLQVPEKLGPMLPELAEVLEGEDPIAKSAFSALRVPEFLKVLDQSGRKQVLLTGIEAHVCVLQTGLDLLDAGYSVHVVSNAVFSRTKENHDLALQRLHDAGATVSSVEMALFELIRTAKHPAFRMISRLVK